MQGNPYSGILSLLDGRVKIPESFMFGLVKIPDPLTVTVSNTDQSGNLMKNADIGELKAGDAVLLVPLENNQKFLILCKVVGA